jgi:hypothetical protein
VDPPRARALHGNAFDVTREYLTYHEEKRGAAEKAHQPSAHGARVESAWIEDAEGRERAQFEAGEEIVLQAVVHEPDDRTPVLMVGIVRATARRSTARTRTTRPFAARLEAAAMRSASGCADRPHPREVRDRRARARSEGLRLFHSEKREVVVTGRRATTAGAPRP